MKIKIITPVPIEKRHGITEGRIMEVVDVDANQGRGYNGYWVVGDDQESVKILPHECEVIDDDR